MAAVIIDGKEKAKEVRIRIRKRINALLEKGISPKLAVVLVGDDPASQVYVRNKERACERVGMQSQTFRLPAHASQEEVLELIEGLNADKSVNGILVQMPVPGHIDTLAVQNAVAPQKDVDGLHLMNSGALASGAEGFVSCTPRGIMELIESTGVPVEGKHAVVVGRSNLVGKPVAFLLLNQNATVTICHSKTKDLADVVRTADILIAAVGRAKMIDGSMIKPGALAIDVGINRMPDGKLLGDVAYESAARTAGYITPVPGGVGPMTIAMLLLNTLEAAERYA